MTRAAGGRDEGSEHEVEGGEEVEEKEKKKGGGRCSLAKQGQGGGGDEGLDEFKITLVTLKSLRLCVFAMHEPPLTAER